MKFDLNNNALCQKITCENTNNFVQLAGHSSMTIELKLQLSNYFSYFKIHLKMAQKTALL